MNCITNVMPSPSRTPVAKNDHDVQGRDETREPHYEVKETADAFGVTVTLPGVVKDGLEITADENRLIIVGKRAWARPEQWTEVYRETSDATYILELTHENSIVPEKVNAELRDGILQISLPKVAAIKPRKISIA